MLSRLTSDLGTWDEGVSACKNMSGYPARFNNIHNVPNFYEQVKYWMQETGDHSAWFGLIDHLNNASYPNALQVFEILIQICSHKTAVMFKMNNLIIPKFKYENGFRPTEVHWGLNQPKPARTQDTSGRHSST